MDNHLSELEAGAARPFCDPLDTTIPSACTGVYSIWRSAELVYVGYAGRAVANASDGRKTGLVDRLRSHGNGRRSGDQFCVYVGDRLVLPELSTLDLQGIASGEVLMDDLIYMYVVDHLSYRYTITPGVEAARAVEDAARAGALKAGKPLLNPLPATKRPVRALRIAALRTRVQ